MELNKPGIFMAKIPPRKLILLACYAILIILGALWHEPWRDEADTWVAMRDVTWHDFLGYFYYTGHPPLWYALQLPFARAGFPFTTERIINILISLATACIITLRSPFPLRMVALILFSVPMAYQFSVIARGYGLMFLLLFGIAATYHSRERNPLWYAALIGLLFNTEIFVILPGLVLAANFLLEAIRCTDKQTRRRRVYGLGIIGAGGLVALISLLPHPNANVYVTEFRYFSTAFLERVRDSALPWAHIVQEPWAGNELAQFLADYLFPLSLPGVALIAGITWLIGKSWVQWLNLSWLAWLYFIFTCKYPGSFYHGEMMMPYTIFLFWMWHNSRPPREGNGKVLRGFNMLLSAILTVSVAASAYEYQTEYRKPYSGAKDMAEFIKSNGLEHHKMFYVGCFSMTGITAYLPTTETWLIREDVHQRYMLWDQTWMKCLGTPFENIAAQAVAQADDKTIIVSENPLLPPLKQLHYSYGRLMFESFWLYQVEKAAPKRQ